MAKRSRMSILKRQRELKKSEKAAGKRAKRHGIRQDGFQEPTPTIGAAELLGLGSSKQEEDEHAEPGEPGEVDEVDEEKDQ